MSIRASLGNLQQTQAKLLEKIEQHLAESRKTFLTQHVNFLNSLTEKEESFAAKIESMEKQHLKLHVRSHRVYLFRVFLIFK